MIAQYLQKNKTGVTMAELHDKIASPDVKKVIGQVVDGMISDHESVYREGLELKCPTNSDMQALVGYWSVVRKNIS